MGEELRHCHTEHAEGVPAVERGAGSIADANARDGPVERQELSQRAPVRSSQGRGGTGRVERQACQARSDPPRPGFRGRNVEAMQELDEEAGVDVL
jgi:hypothetical protein